MSTKIRNSKKKVNKRPPMDFRELDADDAYDKCCGELFLTIKGNIVFHCTLCTMTCVGYKMFESHVRSEHLWTNDVYYNDEYDENYDLEQLDECQDAASIEHQSASESDFSENDENLLEKLLDYNEKQEKRKNEVVKKKPNKVILQIQDGSHEKLQTRSRTIRHKIVNPIKAKTTTSPTSRQIELPSCDRPQLKQLRSLSSALTDKERKHKCPYCVFASKDKTNLWSHIQRHSNNKPHKCEHCPKSFHTRTELTFHTRSHTGERPYLCDDCGRAFVTKQQLKQHIKRHKNERDFDCPQCDKKFYSKPELSAHMTVHTKETPFKCDLCNNVFTRRKALYAHRKLHENKKAYQCQICGMAYNQCAGLYLHMKSKHKLIKPKDENMTSNEV